MATGQGGMMESSDKRLDFNLAGSISPSRFSRGNRRTNRPYLHMHMHIATLADQRMDRAAGG